MSPYVGMTEKAIHEAFHEAEGSVLIIDEADESSLRASDSGA